jgi:murein DD-endopeptidase MepM/ murein hydrolase activator NlpD
MIEQPLLGLVFCRVFVALLPLCLANCAGTGRISETARAPAPASYFIVAVHPGDSLSELAQHYQVKEDDLLAMNDLRGPEHLAAGGRLRIPAYGFPHASPENLRSAKPASDRPRTERTALRDLSPSRAAGPLPIPRPRPEPPARELAQLAPSPAQQVAWWNFDWLSSSDAESNNSVKFLWPLEGRVISSFGASTTGERNDGINISAARGAPVHAAAAGTVTYVGNELKGYGNLVLIRHGNGYVTAYAHSDSVKVGRGDYVERGQIIAYAGSTGDVGEPQLHFELRAGTKPVDPKPYLVASR